MLSLILIDSWSSLIKNHIHLLEMCSPWIYSQSKYYAEDIYGFRSFQFFGDHFNRAQASQPSKDARLEEHPNLISSHNIHPNINNFYMDHIHHSPVWKRHFQQVICALPMTNSLQTPDDSCFILTRLSGKLSLLCLWTHDF